MSENPHKYLIGQTGAEYIRENLAKSDPKTFITEMQSQSGLNLPHMDAIYKVMDFQKWSRLEVHKACLNAQKVAIMRKIESEEIDEEKYAALLERTLPYIEVKELRDIPIKLLAKYPERQSEQVVKTLVQDEAIWEECPPVLKKYVWKSNVDIFNNNMLQLVNQYHHDPGVERILKEARSDCLQDALRQRHSNELFRRIIHAIDYDAEIFTLFSNFLRLVFETTPFPSLCALRYDVLMIMHEENVHEIMKADPCHKLIWHVDTCIKTQSLEKFRIENIKKMMDELRGDVNAWGDAAMMMMEPATSVLFATHILWSIRYAIEEGKSQERRDVDWAYRMLALGTNAHEVISGKLSKAPSIDTTVKDKFLTVLNKLMTADFNAENTQGGENAERNASDEERETLTKCLTLSEPCRRIFCQYVLDRTQKLDLSALQIVLRHVLESFPESAEATLHTFTYESLFQSFSEIIKKSFRIKLLTNNRTRKIIMEEFLIEGARWFSSIHVEVAKILVTLYDEKVVEKVGERIRVVQTWIDRLCTEGAKAEHSEQLKLLYERLLEDSNTVADGRFRISTTKLSTFLESIDEVIPTDQDAEMGE